jgi:DNA-binding MarR family transcriptional regulator
MSQRDGTDVDAVRRFNRFYTRLIGALDEGHLQSAYSLAEVRVLYELARRPATTAVELSRDLGLDAGYLSRILHRFARERLLRRTPAEHDRRLTLLSLTKKGERTFAPLNAGARDHVKELIDPLSPAERKTLIDAMRKIEVLFDRPRGAVAIGRSTGRPSRTPRRSAAPS